MPTIQVSCAVSMGHHGPTTGLSAVLVLFLVSSICMGSATSYDPAFAVPSSTTLSGASARPVGRCVGSTAKTPIASENAHWHRARLMVNAAESMILKAFPIPSEFVDIGSDSSTAPIISETTTGQSRHRLVKLLFSTTAFTPPSTGSIRPMPQQQQQESQLGPLNQPDSGTPSVNVTPPRPSAKSSIPPKATRESLVAPRSGAASFAIDQDRLMPKSGMRLMQAMPGANYQPGRPVSRDVQYPPPLVPSTPSSVPSKMSTREPTADQLAANLRMLDIVSNIPTATVLYAIVDFFFFRKNEGEFVQDVQEDMDEAGQIAKWILDVGERIRNIGILIAVLFVISAVSFDPFQ